MMSTRGTTLRGTFFLDASRSKLGANPSEFLMPYINDQGVPSFLLAEALGSYGFGLEFIFLGMPMQIDFVKGLAWGKLTSPFDYTVTSDWRTKFWIGFDF